MKKILHLTLAVAWPVVSWAQADDTATVAEAVRAAKLLLTDASVYHARVAELCNDAQATGRLYETAENAVRKLDGWPRYYQKNRSLDAFYSCRQSMVDVQIFAYACASGGYKGKAAKYLQSQWLKDSSSCEKAIGTSDSR